MLVIKAKSFEPGQTLKMFLVFVRQTSVFKSLGQALRFCKRLRSKIGSSLQRLKPFLGQSKRSSRGDQSTSKVLNLQIGFEIFCKVVRNLGCCSSGKKTTSKTGPEIVLGRSGCYNTKSQGFSGSRQIPKISSRFF